MSQTRLASESGVGRDTINRLEQGKQQAYSSTLYELAAALSVSPADLLAAPTAEGQHDG